MPFPESAPVTFDWVRENGEYVVTLKNIDLPSQVFTLTRIWCNLKRRYQEKDGFSVVGFFNNGQNGNTHVCKFSVSTANVQSAKGAAHVEEYERFFQTHIEGYVNLINRFIVSEANRESAGLPTYRDLVASSPSEAALKEYLDEFLRQSEVRTEADDRQAAADAKRAAQHAELESCINAFKEHLNAQSVPPNIQTIMFHVIAAQI